jgi:transposase
MYISSLTAKQFKLFSNLFPVVKVTKPKTYSNHEILNAILYILKNGNQWRDLPKDFLMSWQLAYYYFRLWVELDVFILIQESLRQLFRTKKKKFKAGIQKPKRHKKYKTGTVCMIDSQATKNTNSGRNKGFCHYKLTNGIKKHILVDSEGICICTICTPANISDIEGLKLLIIKHKELLLKMDFEKILADLGYNSKELDKFLFDELNLVINLATRVTETKEKTKGFKAQPLRWKSERQFAWCDGCRRLWKNCEKVLDTAENWTYLANIRILAKRMA